MSYHALTHVTGAIQCLVAALYLLLMVHSVRALLSHRSRERSQAYARGVSVSVAFAGLSRPTLLRGAILACTITGSLTVVCAVTVNWLVVPGADAAIASENASSMVNPASNSHWTARGSLCIAMAKITPAGYGVTKGFSYLFFFVKQRTAQTTAAEHSSSHLERMVLHATLGLFPSSIVGSIFFNHAAPSSIDGVCQYRMPLWALLGMLCVDCVLSLAYLYLFIAPLRDMTRKTNPVGSAVSSAVRSAMDLRSVMHKNTVSCLAAMSVTIANISFVVAAHLTNNAILLQLMFTTASIDLTVTSLAMFHLMKTTSVRHTIVAAATTTTTTIQPATRIKRKRMVVRHTVCTWDDVAGIFRKEQHTIRDPALIALFRQDQGDGGTRLQQALGVDGNMVGSATPGTRRKASTPKVKKIKAKKIKVPKVKKIKVKKVKVAPITDKKSKKRAHDGDDALQSPATKRKRVSHKKNTKTIKEEEESEEEEEEEEEGESSSDSDDEDSDDACEMSQYLAQLL